MGTITRRVVAATAAAAMSLALLGAPASAAYRVSGSPAYTPPTASPFAGAATVQGSGWAILV